MEPELSKEPTADSPFSKKNLTKYSPVIIVILVILFILYLIQLGFISFPGLSPISPTPQTPSITPTKSITQKLNNCSVKLGEDPMLIEMSQSGDIITGSLAGNLNSLVLNGKDSATIHLDSFRLEESYDFTVLNQDGMMLDQTKLPPNNKATMADLKKGQVLKVYFNCFPKQPDGKKFRLARVDIIQKR